MKIKPKCGCGCGKRVKGARATYLKGHGTTAAFPCKCKNCGKKFPGSRRDANRCQKCLHNPDQRKCSCGCGTMTFGEYVSGHNLRKTFDYECDKCGRDFSAKSGNSRWCPRCRKRGLCKCGCGENVKTLFSNYLSGHNPSTLVSKNCSRCKRKEFHASNAKQCKKCAKPKPCKCGCGRTVKTTSQGSEYIRGHHPFYASDKHRQMRSLDCKAQRGKQSSIEKILQDNLDGRTFKYTGLDNARGRGTRYDQPMSADFTAPRLKLIVQVDGCYWHGCKKHGQGGKIAKHQRRRDRRLNAVARAEGWTILRVWEHDIKYSLNSVLREIKSVVKLLR